MASKQKIAWLSVASNTFLTSGKIVAGVMTGSVSILSEAAHSAIDLLAAMIATFSVHVSDRPPDADHHYGHDKIENVSGVIEGILIFGAACWIIYEAVEKLETGVELKYLGPGAIIMAVSAAVNLFVATVLKRTAIASRSVALEADAAHLYTDVYTSLGVFLGLGAITIGKYFGRTDLDWLDPAIAICVAVFILKVGFEITRKSVLPLLDVAASPAEEQLIRDAMEEFGRMGVDFHKLRTRRAGATLHVDLHMGCRPGATLEHGHATSHKLKTRIESTVPGARVLIHVEPSSKIEILPDSDERVRCMVDELQKDHRVTEVRYIKAAIYEGEMRVEAKLNVDPKVTMAESRSITDDLHASMMASFPALKDLVIGLYPGDGWQGAIHEDDKERIKELVGEHESSFAGIHGLSVSSSGGRHRVSLKLAVPPSLPVSVAHGIARHLEGDIRELFPEGVEVDLHIEPCSENCDTCKAACPEKSFKSAIT